MLKVPGREFGLGRVNHDNDPTDDVEAEQFESFWLSDREVSVGQFRTFVHATGMVNIASIEQVIVERFGNPASGVNLEAVRRTYEITVL